MQWDTVQFQFDKFDLLLCAKATLVLVLAKIQMGKRPLPKPILTLEFSDDIHVFLSGFTNQCDGMPTLV